MLPVARKSTKKGGLSAQLANPVMVRLLRG